MTQMLHAHFDGRHILLDEPAELPVNAKLFVTVVADDEFERDAWIRLKQQPLNSA